MGYLHINNLYKDQRILLFKECYALEKIHGTSAHIRFKDGKISFFSGGEKHEKFVALFDQAALTQALIDLVSPDVTIFGEAYGGKCQGMSHTYGPSLKFIVFDVQIGECWLDVPSAEDVAKKIGLEFVHYVKIPTDLVAINAARDAFSQQAIRNGVAPSVGTGQKIMEGVVLRPPIEVTLNNGERLIAKHKRDEFKETKTPREVKPEDAQRLEDASKIADEWVTPMRLEHVLDKIPNHGIEMMGQIIAAMKEDVTREATSEIVVSNDALKAIGTRTAKLYKARLQASLKPSATESL